MTTDTGLLYRQHHATMVSYLSRLTRCTQRAEDLAQAVWVRLLAARARGDQLPEGESAVRAYLFTAARNLFIDECTRKHGAARTRCVDPSEFDGLLAEHSAVAPTDEQVLQQEVRGLVQRAVRTLPIEQRKVISMWSHGSSILDMARAAAAPIDTVLSRKKYAFARLRHELRGLSAATG